MSYIFRREDNGELVELGFPEMMEMSAMGTVILPDGAVARRCRHLEPQSANQTGERIKPCSTAPIVSDALGFIEDQHGDFETDRVRNGFTNTEFVRDKDVPQFYQVKFGSEREKRRYMKHRMFKDQNSRNGSNTMTAAQLEQAKALILARFSAAKPPDMLTTEKTGA
jgi:hypothetical protein